MTGSATCRAGSGRHVPARSSPGQLAEQRSYPVLLNISHGGLVDARRAIIVAHCTRDHWRWKGVRRAPGLFSEPWTPPAAQGAEC
jgi:hypothetical protein